MIREALASGVRVVSVDVGDVAMLCRGRQGCRVVETNDCETLADAVEEVLSEVPSDLTPAERSDMDVATTCKEIYSIYGSVLTIRGP